MLILITYEVSTQTPEGRRRLQRVAKYCEGRGIRVQNSVFECILDAAQLAVARHELEKLINPAEDSLRFYTLGERTKRNVVHIGVKPSVDMEGTLMI